MCLLGERRQFRLRQACVFDMKLDGKAETAAVARAETQSHMLTAGSRDIGLPALEASGRAKSAFTSCIINRPTLTSRYTQFNQHCMDDGHPGSLPILGPGLVGGLKGSLAVKARARGSEKPCRVGIRRNA